MFKKIGLLLIFVLLVGCSLLAGTHELSLSGLQQGDPNHWLVLVKVRLPRTISLIIAGGIISICGKIMQHMMQNKFVASESIGLTDSARLGIFLVMRFLPKKDPMMLPLTGVMFGNIIGAISSFLAYRFQLVQNVSSWLQGNFATIMVGQYELLYLTIPVFGLLYFLAYEITIAGLGESAAKSLGINYLFLRFAVFALVAFASSIVLLTVGQIPFLGIVIPNMIGMVFGDHLKNNLLLISFAGSAFLLLCDVLARIVIAPYEMPVSVVAGVLGGCCFLILLLGRKFR
jgi:iron complex transport system permease protein